MMWAPTDPRHEPVRWALVTCGPGVLHAITEEGEALSAEGCDDVAGLWGRLAGRAIYARSPWRTVAASAGDAPEWTIWTWGDDARVTSLQRRTDAGAVRVWPLAGVLGDCGDQVDAAMLVDEWACWLRSHGVQPGAPSSAAAALWTSTLPWPLTVRAPVDCDPRAALFGGRQQAPVVGRLSDVEQQDITCAYPHALASTPTAVAWDSPSRLDLDGDDDGLAEVDLTLPREPGLWGVCPIRQRDDSITWGHELSGRQVTGVWAWADLRVAVDAGATITRARRVWRARSTADVWQQWWHRVVQGRRLANPLVKLTCNRLWGMFAQRPERGRLCAHDAWASTTSYRHVHDPDKPVPPAMATQTFVAAMCAARIRSRLWWEAIRPDLALYVDTDSAITELGVNIEPNSGSPGTWRHQRIMPTAEIAGPQAIRWRTDGHGPHGRGRWWYAVSGVAPHNAASVFDRLASDGGRIMRGPRPGGRARPAPADGGEPAAGTQPLPL